MSNALDELLQIMKKLRDPEHGCAWDRAQTFTSVAPNTLEEAYEVLDAIERDDMENLKDELGDLLFQVVFHSQLAAEANRFTFEEVVKSICDKLVRRHPHVFGDSPADQGSADWETIKAQERAGAIGRNDPSHLDSVPRALSALIRADKLSKRAARVGFDWDEALQSAAKVEEELDEVRRAIHAGTGTDVSANLFEEIGDLLFASANLARKLGIDAESALRAANSKFERRFRFMENIARLGAVEFEKLPLAAQERLWQQAKQAEPRDS